MTKESCIGDLWRHKNVKSLFVLVFRNTKRLEGGIHENVYDGYMLCSGRDEYHTQVRCFSKFTLDQYYEKVSR